MTSKKTTKPKKKKNPCKPKKFKSKEAKQKYEAYKHIHVTPKKKKKS